MIFLQIFIGTLTCILISWLSSFFIIFKKPNFSIEDIIVRIILGSAAMTSLWALIVTKGQTMFILAIPIMILISLSLNKNDVLNTKSSLSKINVLALLLFLIIGITLGYLNIRGTDLNGMKVPINDQSFYTTITNGMYTLNTESSIAYLKPYYSFESLNIPYHYFECWLAVILKTIYNFNTHLIISGSVTAFSFICIFTSFYLFINSWSTKNKILGIGLAIIFVFYRGLVHYLPSIGQNFSQSTDSILFDGNQKLIYILPFFLLGFWYVFAKQESLGILILLLLPSLNIVFLPSIIVGICLYLGFKFIYQIQNLKTYFTENRILFISLITFAICLLIYLKFIALNSVNTGIVTSIGGIVSNMISNGLKWLLINSIILLIIIFLLLKNKNKTYWKIFILSLSIALAGMFGFAVLDNNQNAWQIYACASRFSSFALALLLLYMIKNNFQSFKIALFTFIVIISFMFIENYSSINYLPMQKISSYDSNYLNKINQLKFKNKVGIKIVNAENRPSLQRNPVYAGICNYLVLTENAYSTVVLNIDDLLSISKKDSIIYFESYKNQQLANEIIKISPFLNYSKLINQTISKNEFRSYQINFLKHFKPEFCLIDKGMDIPEFITYKEKFEDSGTGEQFLLLDYH